MPNKNRGDRELKKLARTRMRVTGENYTTARAQILKERALARAPKGPDESPLPR